MRRQEYEQKRQQYEASRKIKRKAQPGLPGIEYIANNYFIHYPTKT